MVCAAVVPLNHCNEHNEHHAKIYSKCSSGSHILEIVNNCVTGLNTHQVENHAWWHQPS